MGLVATILLLFGFAGLLTRLGALVLLSICLLTGYPFFVAWCRHGWGLVRFHPRSSSTIRLASGSVFLLLLLAMVPILLLASYPPWVWDELAYHLPLARAYAASHHVGAQPFVRFWMFPQLNEILFAGALLLRDDVTAHYLVLMLFLLTAAALFSTGRRLQSTRAAMWAAGLWLGCPLAVSMGTTAYVDIGLSCFVTLASCALLLYLSTRDRHWIALCGVLAGFGAATKYTGLCILFILAAACFLLGESGSRLRITALFCAFAGASLTPWYLRTAVLTGNPVSPFLGRLFGFKFWDQNDVDSLRLSLQATGVPRTPTAFLGLPWHLVTDPQRFGPNAPITPILFALLPLLLFLPLGLKLVRRAAILVFAYLVVWFLTAQDARFLLPVLPMLALACAAWIDHLFSRLRFGPKTSRRVTAMVFLVALAPGALFAARRVHWFGPPPATAGARRSFVEEEFPESPCYETLNERYGSHYRIYAFHDEVMAYYAQGTLMGDWFGPGRYANIDLSTGEGLFRCLRSQGAQFLAVNRSSYGVKLPEDSDFHAHFKVICSTPGMEMYRLVAAPWKQSGKTE
jgi:4-amino-4-deoxy-L-arabinose transferase-like glycosyltransferase